MDRDDVTRAAVAEIVRHGEGRGSWLVFCSGVAHARHVRDAIRGHGVSCETVTGDTPGPERDGILAAFKAGRLRCVTNANVLTTGFDAPGTDLIALLRPTKSVGLYVQMVGRGTRLAEGKEDCLVLDFAGNTARHGPIDTVDGGKKETGGAPAKRRSRPARSARPSTTPAPGAAPGAASSSRPRSCRSRRRRRRTRCSRSSSRPNGAT